MRLRFAPSPTGALHIGGARTALFNWLLARHSGGALVLRIEDTDRERSTPENVQQILDALQWLGLDWDEGPVFQTERSERHREVLERLLEQGHAYHSNATAQDVKAFKELYGADRGFRGQGWVGSQNQGAGNQNQGAVRLRVPDEGATVVGDLIRGETSFEHVHLDDPVIARADGSVLYNFAVAVDDLDAAITHVVRGEDHLSNTPKQLLVLQAAREVGFGAGAELPLYAHLPLLHGPDGKKLSKRHGAASVQELRDAGYLPEAVCNYIALLGWGAGDDTTVLSTEQLIERFTLERVSRNPARFDEVKLRWLNGVHIRSMPVAELARRVLGHLAAEDPAAAEAVRAHDPALLEEAVRISQEKIHTLRDFWPLAGFLFTAPSGYDRAARERWLTPEGIGALRDARTELARAGAEQAGAEQAGAEQAGAEQAGAEQADIVGAEGAGAGKAGGSFGVEAVAAALEGVVERRKAKPREVYQPLRVAISGTTVSPGIFESVALLGREETLRRIDAALDGR